MSIKSRYRVTNWREYNLSLKMRGSLTIWFNDDIEQHWYASSSSKRKQGRQLIYSDSCMECLLSLRHLFNLPLRQLTGFVESLFSSTGKDLRVPDFSLLSRRAKLLDLKVHSLSCNEPIHMVIDSTGLKVSGEKEWLETKYGKQYQRKVWRKLHIGIDPQGHIISEQLTDHKTDDRSLALSLIDSANKDTVTELLADSGYDSHKLYQELENREIKVLIPTPIHSVIFSNNTLTARDKVVAYMKARGYWAWFKKNNFGRRAKVENTFYRIKTVFGRKLLSRSMDNQRAEVRMICSLLNKMTNLGMPKTVEA